MSRMVVPIYQSGTSRIAILHSEWLDDGNSLHEQEWLNLSKEIHKQSWMRGFATNKIAILKTSSNRKSFAVKFLQYIPDTDQIDYSGNCGNATIASFVYLVELGLVEQAATAESINTGQFLRFQYKGKDQDGTQLVHVEYLDPIGTLFDELAPTGSMITEVTFDQDQTFEVSILDAGNPYVWIRATDLANQDVREWGDVEYRKMLQIRAAAQAMLGLNPHSVFPKVAVVAPSLEEEHDLLVRMISVPSWHKTFPITGIVNLCTSAAFSGNIIDELLQKSNRAERSLCLSVMTPGGPIRTQTVLDEMGSVHSVFIEQKARQLGGIEIEAHLRIAR